jgi:hypothetical protein
MKEEQLSDIYILMVKPGTTWEEETEDGEFSIIALSDKESTAIIMDLKEEHHVRELEKYEVYNVPERFEEVKFKNASEVNKSYIITKKGLINEHS